MKEHNLCNHNRLQNTHRQPQPLSVILCRRHLELLHISTEHCGVCQLGQTQGKVAAGSETPFCFLHAVSDPVRQSAAALGPHAGRVSSADVWRG